ncbi:MAG: hypothetical protein K6E54_02490 [Bacteroidaceae bacterium]|nr:hypothetical protein [Bacteroidaceae bacterium]
MGRNKQHIKKANIQVSLTQQIEVSVGKSTLDMRGNNKIIEISNQNEVYYLRPDTILYVVADGNYCDIHLTDGDILETVSFQRAEIARKIDKQLSMDLSSKFALVGKPYLVNLEHIMYINVQHQQLTFDINQPGTCKKKSIKASTNALRNLRQALDTDSMSTSFAPVASERKINGGFAQYLSAVSNANKTYETGEDEVMILGR